MSRRIVIPSVVVLATAVVLFLCLHRSRKSGEIAQDVPAGQVAHAPVDQAPSTPAGSVTAEPPGHHVDEGSADSKGYGSRHGSEVEAPSRPAVSEPPRVERYCTIESPDRVASTKRMPVLVSLTAEPGDTDTELVSGSPPRGPSAQGPVLFPTGEIQVVLAAPAFDIAEAIRTLEVPEEGDSTPVMFELVARPIEAASLESRLQVTFWRNGALIARAFRRVTIVRDVAPEPARALAIEASAPKGRASTALHEQALLADLTLSIWSDEGRSDTASVTVASPYRQTPRHEIWALTDLEPWLEAHVAPVIGPSRGVSTQTAPAGSDRKAALADWIGIGRECYRRLAPPAFQQMYWELADELGPKFRTIRIETDLPWIPFELMRPTRPDGSEEHDFLGARMLVGRWHFSERTSRLAPPPQQASMHEFLVIAPRYDADRSLPSQVAEVAGLKSFRREREVPGQLDAMRKLLADPPQAIVHFAGHGLATEVDGRPPTYSILMEDGPLDLTTWLGLAPPRLATHPFLFLNSCDVGRAHRVARFVEGWAPAALELGACGTIGSLWPLDDAGAAAFALEFYRNLFASQIAQGCVAAALRETRRRFLAEDDALALAYVYYGDPNLTLDL